MFDSFDKEQDGYVQAKDVPGILRILGVTMTEQEGSHRITKSSTHSGTEPSSRITLSSPPR
jgi:Ca2+-binding EF-hand superfamily protein